MVYYKEEISDLGDVYKLAYGRLDEQDINREGGVSAEEYTITKYAGGRLAYDCNTRYMYGEELEAVRRATGKGIQKRIGHDLFRIKHMTFNRFKAKINGLQRSDEYRLKEQEVLAKLFMFEESKKEG